MSAAPRTVSATPATLEALEAAYARIVDGPPGAAEKSLLAQAFDDYAADETPELGGDDLAALLGQTWRSAQSRKAGEPARVTVSPLAGADGAQTGYDSVLILQDDAPFLVDSVLGELAEAGVTVRALFHPIVEVEGTRGIDVEGDVVEVEAGRRDSLIIVVIDPLPQERRDALGEGLAQAMADVRAAVADHAAMVQLMRDAVEQLEASPPAAVDPAVLEENIAFLRWAKSDHFVFLGARDYAYPRSADGGYAAEAPLEVSDQGLGILNDPERRVLRRASEPAVLTPAMQRQLDESEPVTVAKANMRSRVHRRAYMDYVGVKRYGADGKASGETRFVGLFTAEAYDKMAKEVPLIRRKVANALERAGKRVAVRAFPSVGDQIDTRGLQTPPGLAQIPAFAALRDNGTHKIANPAEIGALLVMGAPAVAGEVSDEARRASLGAMTNLMCRGRKRGLAGVMNPFDKNAIELALTLKDSRDDVQVAAVL